MSRIHTLKISMSGQDDYVHTNLILQYIANSCQHVRVLVLPIQYISPSAKTTVVPINYVIGSNVTELHIYAARHNRPSIDNWCTLTQLQQLYLLPEHACRHQLAPHNIFQLSSFNISQWKLNRFPYWCRGAIQFNVHELQQLLTQLINLHTLVATVYLDEKDDVSVVTEVLSSCTHLQHAVITVYWNSEGQFQFIIVDSKPIYGFKSCCVIYNQSVQQQIVTHEWWFDNDLRK